MLVMVNAETLTITLVLYNIVACSLLNLQVKNSMQKFRWTNACDSEWKNTKSKYSFLVCTNFFFPVIQVDFKLSAWITLTAGKDELKQNLLDQARYLLVSI